MKQKKIWMVIILLVVLGLACRTTVSTPNLDDFNLPGDADQTDAAQTQSVATQPAVIPTVVIPSPVAGDILNMENLLVQLYDRTSPGVVAIQTLSTNGGGLGSGFVFDREGHIVTNFHVIDQAEDLEVDFSNGIKVRGEVIGTDIDSDLAVIKVDVPAEQLSPLPMGDSDQVRVGQTVVAIGNPFGLSGTMTMGIISAKGRTLESLREAGDGSFFSAGDLIQTDASINPGNSGGPLLNLNGEVIGLNRAIRTTGVSQSGDPINSGIGFAVSVNIIKRVVPVLIEQGSYDYPYLGVTARPEISLIEQEELDLSQTLGAYVVAVTPGSPADRAGIRSGDRPTNVPGLLAGGDLIVGVDGRPVQVFGDLLSYLMTSKSPGDEVVLTVIRDDETLEVPLTLGKRP